MPTNSTGPKPRDLRALLVPVGTAPAEVIDVEQTGEAISDALGGHLLDDTTVGELPGGRQVTFYRSDDPQGLPENPEAAELAAMTAVTDRQALARLRGPVLVLGLDGTRDVSIPDELLVVAHRTGLFRSAGAGRTPPGDGMG